MHYLYRILEKSIERIVELFGNDEQTKNIT